MSFSTERVPIESTVERSIRYATTVDTLGEAWAFVMDKLDDPMVGPTPTIKISPTWILRFGFGEEAEDGPVEEPRFSVVVDGWMDLGVEKTNE